MIKKQKVEDSLLNQQEKKDIEIDQEAEVIKNLIKRENQEVLLLQVIPNQILVKNPDQDLIQVNRFLKNKQKRKKRNQRKKKSKRSMTVVSKNQQNKRKKQKNNSEIRAYILFNESIYEYTQFSIIAHFQQEEYFRISHYVYRLEIYQLSFLFRLLFFSCLSSCLETRSFFYKLLFWNGSIPAYFYSIIGGSQFFFDLLPHRGRYL